MHTIQAILSSCPHQVSACHKAKALDIDQALHAGVPHDLLAAADSIVRLSLAKSDTVQRVKSVLER